MKKGMFLSDCCKISNIWRSQNKVVPLHKKYAQKMEEKKYTIFEEEFVGEVCEPVASVTAGFKYEYEDSSDDDCIDDLACDCFPSLGPFSKENAIDRIDKFEDELANGRVKWVSSEEAWKQLYKVQKIDTNKIISLCECL